MCPLLRAGIRGMLRFSIAAIAITHAYSQTQSVHRFDVRDSIAMTTFSTPSGLRNGLRVESSPNGRYFWFVTSREILDTNQIESTLWLIPSNSVRAFLDGNGAAHPTTPHAMAHLRAVPTLQANSSYASLISDVQWSDDSRKVYFLGQVSGASRRLYEIDIAANRCHAITPHAINVQQYARQNVHLALTATPAIPHRRTVPWKPDEAINAGAGTVTGMGLEDILQFPQETHGFGSIDRVPTLWTGTAGQIYPVVPANKEKQEDVEHSQEVLSISPDGRMVIRLLSVSYTRPEWSFYKPMSGFESWRIRADDQTQVSPQNWYRLREYMLTDTQTGKTTSLVDAPSGDSLAVQDRSLAVWSPNGERVLLGNIALPLNGVDEDEKQRRTTICAVADVEIATHKVQCVVFSRDAVNVGLTAANPHPLRLRDASWEGNTDAITLRFNWHDKWGQVERYRRLNGKWTLQDVLPADPVTAFDADDAALSSQKLDHVALSIRQNLNTPPALWASDTRSEESKQLWAPNPQLSQMALGKASLYHWNDKTGYTSTGILVLPPDYRPGNRYPLVIQTHGVWENIFITDGSYTTAMAARPLASAGMVVLQTQWNATHFSERQEASDQVEMFDAAIAQLSRDGIIDDRKVGIIGFSRTCGHVEQALISNPDRYAAATIADGMDVGYLQYMLFADGRPALAREYEKIVGTLPIGDGLKSWIDYSPSFHMDKVKTPLRIEAIDPSSILTMWETYAALRRLHRPVDLIYIAGAQHILQRPQDRVASEQGNVDWFRFWLQGYVDTNPIKSAQYARWMALKKLQ